MCSNPSEDSEVVPVSPQSKHFWTNPEVLTPMHWVLYVVSKVTAQGQDLKDDLTKLGEPSENSGDGE